MQLFQRLKSLVEREMTLQNSDHTNTAVLLIESDCASACDSLSVHIITGTQVIGGRSFDILGA